MGRPVNDNGSLLCEVLVDIDDAASTQRIIPTIRQLHQTSNTMASGPTPAEQQLFNFTLAGTPGATTATTNGTPQTAGYNEAESSGVGTNGTTTGFRPLSDAFDGLSTTVPDGLIATRTVEATRVQGVFIPDPNDADGGGTFGPSQTSAITQSFASAGVPNAVRVIDAFTNNTDAPITGTVTYRNNLGSDGSTRYDAQGSGSRYLVSNQSLGGAGPTDPTVTGVFGNTGATANPALNFANGNDSQVSSYTITVQPGQTVRLVTFGVVTGDVNRQGSNTDANNDGVPDEVVNDVALGTSIADKITNGGNPIPVDSPFFSGLTAEERATVANFKFAPSDAPCFVTGTQIRTKGGEVAVESLKVGDQAVTASGALRPITWIGHRTLDLRRHANQAAAQPIKIAKDAFAPGRPVRDLFVSAGHPICVDMLGEVLIPALSLVNGTTVQQASVDSVTYWHVELDSHDILLAENLPAESYLDANNRSFFHDRAPVPSVGGASAGRCRPFFADGALVDVVRERLSDRAELLGWRKSSDMDIHLTIDGVRAEPVCVDGLVRFLVPAEAEDVRLMSASFRPSWGSDKDDRRLSIAVSSIRISDGLFLNSEIAPSDERLADGFHAAESKDQWSWRWTTGCARLPRDLWADASGDVFLSVAFNPAASERWIEPTNAYRIEEAEDLDNVVRLTA